MSSAREDVWREAYDPPRVSWQTDALYRVEHARRRLQQARHRLLQALAQHERYEDEARQRAIALKLAQQERIERREVRMPRVWSEARWEAYRETERIAAEKQKAALARWGSWEKRNRWIYERLREGGHLKDIAQEVDLSRARIQQICKKQERLNEQAKRRAEKHWLRANPGRPVDIDGDCGGAREVWLTYYPPFDPRLDNMEPVGR